MKKNVYLKDFDYYIDEYMYNCRSRKLRPKTISFDTTNKSALQSHKIGVET